MLNALEEPFLPNPFAAPAEDGCAALADPSPPAAYDLVTEASVTIVRVFPTETVLHDDGGKSACDDKDAEIAALKTELAAVEELADKYHADLMHTLKVNEELRAIVAGQQAKLASPRPPGQPPKHNVFMSSRQIGKSYVEQEAHRINQAFLNDLRRVQMENIAPFGIMDEFFPDGSKI